MAYFVALALFGFTMSGVLNKYTVAIEKAIGGFLLFLVAGLFQSFIQKLLVLRLLQTS